MHTGKFRGISWKTHAHLQAKVFSVKLLTIQTTETIGRYGRGGVRGRQRRCLVPHWKRHCSRDDEGFGNEVGHRKYGNESAGIGRTAETG